MKYIVYSFNKQMTAIELLLRLMLINFRKIKVFNYKCRIYKIYKIELKKQNDRRRGN
jgi:hypothetical protein